MSDMVQQPVIQLVQELTMTAVVERHDCTDTKKEEKSRSPRPRLNTSNASVVPPFLGNITYLTYLDRGAWNPWRTSQAFIGGYPKTRLEWRQGTEDLSLLKRCWWAPSQCFRWGQGGDSPSLPLEEGRREGMLVMYSNGANSAGHLAIYKVVLRY